MIRERIEIELSARPGLWKSKLGRRVGTSWGNLTHHLDNLMESGRITEEWIGGKVHYFPSSVPAEQRRPLAAMQQDNAGEIVELIQSGRNRLVELEEAMGLSRKKIRSQLKHLIQAGLVEVHGVHRPILVLCGIHQEFDKNLI